jgi:site-specific DNA recombinase
MEFAIYTRVSSDEQVKGESLEIQLQRCQALCEQRDWIVYQHYQDPGYSGDSIEGRPAFSQLLADAALGLFNVVVVTKLDRFAREFRVSADAMYRLKDLDVHLVAVEEPIDTTSSESAELMFIVYGGFASHDYKQLQKKMRDARIKKMREGRCFSGKAPHGLKWVKEQAQFVIVPEQAETVKEIYDMYLQGNSMREIALQLKRRGVMCHKRPFSTATLSYLLKNPVYYGHYVLNKTVYDKHKRTKKQKPPSEWITMQVPPIVDKITWDKVQERREFNRIKTKHAHDKSAYWLRDHLQCSHCGGTVKPVHGAIRKKRPGHPRYYRCHWSICSEKTLELAGRNRCPLPTLKAKELEQAVWHRVLHALTFMDQKKKYLGQALRPDRWDQVIKKHQAQVSTLKRKLARKEAQKDNLYEMIANPTAGEAVKNEFMGKIDQIITDIAGVKAQLAQAQQNAEEAEQGKHNDRLLKRYLKDKEGTLKRMAQALHQVGSDDKYRLLTVMARGPIVVDGYKDGLAIQPHTLPTNVDDKVIKILEELASKGKLGGGSNGSAGSGSGRNGLSKAYRNCMGPYDWGNHIYS